MRTQQKQKRKPDWYEANWADFAAFETGTVKNHSEESEFHKSFRKVRPIE